MLFRWKEVRTWRTKAHTRARSFVYLHRSSARECVSAAHSPSVYIYIYPYLHTVWVFRVKWCLSSFFREAHTTGTLSRIIWASCPASHSILFGNNIHVACMRAIPPEYISTSFWPALSASFVLFLVLYTISHTYITFCRRHFCKVCRCTDRVCFFSLFPALFFWLAPFFSLSLSLVHIHIIYLLSSLCWVGNQSLGTQAHYPCTVSTGLWFFDCVVCTKIFINYYFECDISFHT